MSDFTMPSLGADMDQGTLLEWLVAPGDEVHRGDPVAVVDTSKAAIEVECFADGVVGELLVSPGTTVAVGTPLARIDGHGATPAPAPAPAPAPQPASAPERAPVPSPPAPEQPPEQPPAPVRKRRRPARPSVRATPLARRLAEELGVDIEQLGRRGGLPVRAEDVRAAAGEHPGRRTEPEAAPAAPPAPAHHETMRATIAARMTRANREIPHYFLATSVDLERATRWLHEHNLGLPVAERVVPAALLLKATALAAAATPELNGFWLEDRFVPGEGVQLGVATSLRGGGLLAPVLRDADHLPLDDLMRTLRDLVARARKGRLRATELSDPTITVTNLGEQGVDSVHGVIYPPQVALVGFGRIADRPVAVDGLLGVRPTTTLTLAADHRATDGFTGSRFLALIDRHLQHPEDL